MSGRPRWTGTDANIQLEILREREYQARRRGTRVSDGAIQDDDRPRVRCCGQLGGEGEEWRVFFQWDVSDDALDLDAIWAALAKATPGPWVLQMEERYETGERDAPYVYGADGSVCVCSGQTYYPQQVTPADAAFIAAARSDIPALLASHAALEQRVAEANTRYAEIAERVVEVETETRRAEQRVRDLEAALESITERTSYSIDPVLAFEEALSRARAALRGTGEGNRG